MYKKRSLESSETPVLYTGRTVLNLNTKTPSDIPDFYFNASNLGTFVPAADVHANYSITFHFSLGK